MGSPFILAVTFTIICLCKTSAAENSIEQGINEIFDEFRKRMCHPIPKWGLPALDPFEISHLEFEADNKYLRDFSGSVTELRLVGLSDFIDVIKITTFPLPKFAFNITFPLTSLRSLYTAKGSIAKIINLSGDCMANAQVTDVRILITGSLKLGITLGIRNLKITININKIEVDLGKLIEEERVNDFVHALINELGLELLDDIWQTENASVEEIAQQKVNDILKNFSLSDIIAIINGSGDNPIFGPEDPDPDCKDEIQSFKTTYVGQNNKLK